MCDDVRSIDSRQRQYSALHCIAPVLWHVSVCFSGCSWILASCATFYGRSYFSCTLILKSPAISGSSVPDRMLSTCAFCACACSGSKGNQETQLSLTNLRRVYKSVKVTEHGTIPYVSYSFLLWVTLSLRRAFFMIFDFKNVVILKSGSEVTQGHWKWYHYLQIWCGFLLVFYRNCP